MSSDPRLPTFDRASARFATTHWTMVLAAGRKASPESGRALAALCDAYWLPIYGFRRRQGCSTADAQDYTQQFFAELLEKNSLAVADPQRGRFRSFLLTAVKNFLSHQRERARAQKRGGDRKHLSLDFDWGEQRYQLEPPDRRTPEALFEHHWALALLDRVLARLRGELEVAGKASVFDELKAFLVEASSTERYAAVAERLGTTPGAARVAVHRLRRRYKELLLAEIAQTVADPADAEAELRDLFAAVRSPE
jgi:RNA polymerase sigma-70 factor (ECF subfamily)